MVRLLVKSKKEHYTADACVVWCYDNRFWKAFQNLLEDQKIKYFDPIFIAGGSKSIASPDDESERNFVLKQIELSIKLHNASHIILMNHSDCGGYGGLKFSSEEEEYLFHKKELEEARKVVQERFPKIRVKAIFVGFEEIWFLDE